MGQRISRQQIKRPAARNVIDDLGAFIIGG
jgi:hypothetical protein